MHSFSRFPVVEVCGEGVAYRALFGYNPVALSGVFDLMNRYRDSFESLHRLRRSYDTHDEKEALQTSLESIHYVNNYLANACDVIEREKVPKLL